MINKQATLWKVTLMYAATHPWITCSVASDDMSTLSEYTVIVLFSTRVLISDEEFQPHFITVTLSLTRPSPQGQTFKT